MGKPSHLSFLCRDGVQVVWCSQCIFRVINFYMYSVRYTGVEKPSLLSFLSRDGAGCLVYIMHWYRNKSSKLQFCRIDD